MFNPYSLQFNSNPRSLHQNGIRCRFITSNPANNIMSHPYIIAQNKKQQHNNMNSDTNNTNPQGIISTNNRHRKRKYMETLDETNINQSQYAYEPQKKQRITENIVIQSIRDLCVENDDMNSNNINSVDHSLNALSLDKYEMNTKAIANGIKKSRKRRLNEMEINDLEYKNEICNKMNKKMKIWDAKSNKSYGYYPKIKQEYENDMNEIEIDSNCDSKLKDENLFENSELIPKIIQFANFINNDNAFITKLCRNDTSLNKMKLNKYTGAVVKYEEPKKESWKELIQTYYETNQDIVDELDDDCEMDSNKSNESENDTTQNNNDCMDCD